MLLPVYRNNGDSRQLQSLHCAAADWQWNTRDEAALASVSRHYAAALNAEAFSHGEAAAVIYTTQSLDLMSALHEVLHHRALMCLLSGMQCCQMAWIRPRRGNGTCTSAVPSCW